MPFVAKGRPSDWGTTTLRGFSGAMGRALVWSPPQSPL